MKKDYVAVWYRKKGNKLELIPKEELKALQERFKDLIGGHYEEEYAYYMIEHERYEGFSEDKIEPVYNQGDYMEIWPEAFEGAIVMRIYRERNAKSYEWRHHQGTQWVKPEHHISELYLFKKNNIELRDVLKLSYPYKYVFFDKNQVIHQTNSEKKKNMLKNDPSMVYFLSLKINIADFEDVYYTPKSRKSRKSRKRIK